MRKQSKSFNGLIDKLTDKHIAEFDSKLEDAVGCKLSELGYKFNSYQEFKDFCKAELVIMDDPQKQEKVLCFNSTKERLLSFDAFPKLQTKTNNRMIFNQEIYL